MHITITVHGIIHNRLIPFVSHQTCLDYSAPDTMNQRDQESEIYRRQTSFLQVFLLCLFL